MTEPSYWSEMKRLWALQGTPLRPPAEAVDRMVAAAGGPGVAALLLGVTPEFHGRFARLTAVDAAPAMVAHVWPGDAPGRRAIRGGWAETLPRLGRFAAVIGDGALNTQADAAAVAALLGAVDAALAPGGRFVTRVYCQPEAPIPPSEIRDGVAEGALNFHAVRLRLGMRLAQLEGGFAPVRGIAALFDEIFPDRAAFVSDCRDMTPAAFALLDAYAGSEDRWWVPDRAALLAAASGMGGAMRLMDSGGYALASDCPLLIVEAAPPYAPLAV